MSDMDWLTWLCIVGIAAAGVMNLRHTESTMVIRPDYREKLDGAQADKYQSGIGVVYLLTAAIACITQIAAEGKVYMAGLFVAAAVLVGGTVLLNRRYLPGGKGK